VCNESVFECVIAPEELAALVAQLQRLIEADEAANIRIYRQCGSCWPEAIGTGRLIGGEQEPCTIV
jgi:CRISPR-associated endonuclease Cas2